MESHFQNNLRFYRDTLLSKGFSAVRLDELEAGGLFSSVELIHIASLCGETPSRILLYPLEEQGKQKDAIRLVVFDVDGVLTEAGMYYTEGGDEFKRFNARDGIAMRALRKAGFQTAIISHGINENLIRRRAELLDIPLVYCGTEPKSDVLARWCNQLNISFDNCAFIGDDINDLSLFRVCGFTACPADATDPVKEIAHVLLRSEGGNGCVREWVDRYFFEKPIGA